MLTLILAGQTISAFALDWTPNHLLNPQWHPHARFHGGLLLFFLAGASAAGCGYSGGAPPNHRGGAAAMISPSFWTPLLYAGLLVPGWTPWAGDPAHIPHLSGRVFIRTKRRPPQRRC